MLQVGHLIKGVVELRVVYSALCASRLAVVEKSSFELFEFATHHLGEFFNYDWIILLSALLSRWLFVEQLHIFFKKDRILVRQRLDLC